MSDQLSGVITDVRLPGGIDGWQVARRAREVRPDLPIIYITAGDGADWAVQGVPKSELLQKPFAPAQLVTAISNLLTANDQNMLRSYS